MTFFLFLYSTIYPHVLGGVGGLEGFEALTHTPGIKRSSIFLGSSSQGGVKRDGAIFFFRPSPGRLSFHRFFYCRYLDNRLWLLMFPKRQCGNSSLFLVLLNLCLCVFPPLFFFCFFLSARREGTLLMIATEGSCQARVVRAQHTICTMCLICSCSIMPALQ